MKIELWIIGITGFLIWNAYHEGKYMKMILDHKKYFQMAGIGFAGLAFVLFLRKHPTHSQSMLMSASSLVKYLPMDQNTSKVLSPVLDMTRKGFGRNVGIQSYREQMSNMNTQQREQMLQQSYQGGMPYGMGRMVNSGVQANNRATSANLYRPSSGLTKRHGKQSKRSVSEARKKYIAAQQAWRCGHCSTLLDATYEVDHKVALMNGGTNDVNNLIALCPNCHRKKTSVERLGIQSTGGL